MATATMRQTTNNVTLMGETVVCLVLSLIIAQVACVNYLRLVLLDLYRLLLVMDFAMTKQTMFTAYLMALTAADLPSIQTPARIAYVMVSPILYKISLCFV